MHMEVMILARGIPTEENSQNGIFEYDQAIALYNLGLKIKYLAIDVRSIRKHRRWGLYKDKENSRKNFDVYVFNVPLGPIPLKVRLFFEKIMLYIAYIRIYRKGTKPDIIHCHFYHNGYISSVLNKFGIPIIVTEHSSDINRKHIPSQIKKIAIKAYKNADCVIAVSKSLADRIKSISEIDPIIVYNMVNIDIFQKSSFLEHEGFGIVTASNLTQIKQVDFLIQAFFEFHKMHSNSYLGIIGDGEERGSIQKLINEMKLNDSIELYGRKKRDEISKIYEKYDVFAMVSKSETFGVAYAEAIASGLPVIATNVGGACEFVNEDNGILVSTDKVDNIAYALEVIYERHKNFSREKMEEGIRKKYAPNVIAEKLVYIYKTLV